MHRSCSSLLQMLLPMLLALSGSTVKAATQDQEWAQERANAVLSLMTFTVVPDITASNLDIGSGTNQSAALNMTQIGGGATMSEAVPIYLEGAIGFSRYDPQFVVSNGTESRTLPTKWNSLTASGGIGWDIALHEDPRGGHWVLRPITNVSLGTMASDLRIGNWLLERTKGYSLDFLDGGQLNMYGLGGSLMLDYELFSKTQAKCATPTSTCRALAAPRPASVVTPRRRTSVSICVAGPRCSTGPCSTDRCAMYWRGPIPHIWGSSGGCLALTPSTLSAPVWSWTAANTTS